MDRAVAAGSTRAGVLRCRECRGDRAGAAKALLDLGRRHPAMVRVGESDCLDRCDYAVVVVVRPSPAGRRDGGRPTWFGFVDARAVQWLGDWVGAGGPGLADLPDVLALHQISRPPTARAR